MSILMSLLMVVGGSRALATDLYSIPVKTIDGDAATLAAYRGKTLLIVNTASKCGFTKQYEALERVSERYAARGVVVLGFPSNDFGAQEPGSDAEIKSFCQTKFKVKFPLFAKAPVSGANKQPLYDFLTREAPKKGEVQWNFEKFVVSPEGRITARFDSAVEPEDRLVTAALEASAPRDKAREAPTASLKR